MMVLSTDIVVGAAPPRKAGSAASMLETSGELGVALGVATLGSVGTAVYGAQVDGSIPAGLHPDAAEAARSTLAGALSVADNLSAGAAVQLVDAAKAAFTAGLGTVAGVGAGRGAGGPRVPNPPAHARPYRHRRRYRHRHRHRHGESRRTLTRVT
jgi:DHA2 family multidrug resistance protein-like MFS transporter